MRKLACLLALFVVAPALAQSGTVLNPKISNKVRQANAYASGTGTTGSPYTSASGTGGLQEAANSCAATGCTVHLGAGTYKMTAMAVFGKGVFLDGDGPLNTIVNADATFSGAAVLRWKNPTSDNSFAGTVEQGIGARNLTVNVNGVAAHGVQVFKGYDYVEFDNVAVLDAGDAVNAFRFEPNTAYAASVVSQTVLLNNLYGIHKNTGATAPVFYFAYVQELTLNNVKGFGGYATGTGNCDVFYFLNCRGVTMVGGAAAISQQAGIHIASDASGTSQGLAFYGVTLEAVTPAVKVIGTTNSVQDLAFSAMRKQEGTVSPAVTTGAFTFARAIRVHADIPMFTATVDANSQDVCLRLKDLDDLTSDSGTRTVATAGYSTTEAWFQVATNRSLGLFPKDSSGPEVRFGHGARTDYWRAFWSASSGAEFGYQLRYVTTGAVSKRAAVFDSGAGSHFYYNDVEALTVGNAAVTATGTLDATGGYIGNVTAGSGKTINATAGTSRVPNSTSLPGSCTTGDTYQDTDATAGQQIYHCEGTVGAAGTWRLEGDGGGSVAFSALAGGTNATSPMVVGTGASLSASGSGTIAATSVPGTGVSGNITGTAANVSGTVLETHGGTAQTSYAQGDMLYASAPNTLSKLVKSTSDSRYLCNQGASNAPAWCYLNLSTGVDPTTALPATVGGTGLFGGTQTALLYWSSATAIGTSASLGENAIVIGHTGSGGPTGSAATATAAGSIALPTAQTLDIAAHATDGGVVVLKEGADDGSNTFTLKVPDAGLTASKTMTLVAATGNLPASGVESSGTADKCAKFNASGILIAASGDCAAGGGGTGTVTGVGPGCTTGLCYTNATVTAGTVFSVWEGATSDANQWNINVPADPTAVINWTILDATTALTFPSGTDTLTGKATTDTLTNKTISYASNTITTTEKVWLQAAGCNNATAASFWDLPTANAPTPTCVTGSNTQKSYLDFPDADGAYSAQYELAVPSGWTGTLAAKIKWLSAITTGNVFWQVSTICVADAETDDPAFNTASSVADAAKGTTNQTNDAAIASVTVTGCAAGELMHIKIMRDRTDGSDTLGASAARLVGVELTLIRTVAI